MENLKYVKRHKIYIGEHFEFRPVCNLSNGLVLIIIRIYPIQFYLL